MHILKAPEQGGQRGVFFMGRRESVEEPVRCAIYTRVSSEEQAKEGYSLETQERLCRQKLDVAFGPGLYEAIVYTDDGFKGTWGLYDSANPKKKFRPALTRMLEAFRSGMHNVICSYRLDRIWRRAALADFLADSFLPHGLTRLICVREHVDLSTASGRFHMNMMAAAGAFEAELLGERVADSLEQRKQDGFAIGPPPYGWRWQTDAEMAPGQRRRGITPEEGEADAVRWMAERYLAGDSILSITQQLNERGVPTKRGGQHWSRSSVKRALANPKQAGLLETAEGEYMPGHHHGERLYEPEVFHQILARMSRDSQNHAGSAHVPEYLLGGLIRCGHCGHPLNCRRVKRTNRRYYRCSAGTALGTETACIGNAKPADVVEAVVLAELREVARSDDVQEAAAEVLKEIVGSSERRMHEDVARLERQLEGTWAKYEHWADRHYGGDLTLEEFEFHRKRFLEEKTGLKRRLDDLRRRLRSGEQRSAELRQAQEALADFDRVVEGLTSEQKREMVQLLVGRAEMFHEEDGTTRVTFDVRFHGDFEKIIPKLNECSTVLTPRQMEVYALWADGLDRREIARKLGVTAPCVTGLLWQGRRRAGADTYEECYELARADIESNQAILFTGRRRRKSASGPNRPVLTDTQSRVLSLHGEGLTGPEIAERLDIGSTSTVYVHLKNCRDRLGRATNEEAIKHAREMGYIE
jgi:site-specific DNA recombinase